MTRGVGLVLVLISLAIVGGLTVMQSKTQGPAAAAVRNDESLALATAASVGFSQVDQVLQADYGATGTYVGAEFPLGSGVTLVQATQTSYCLEMDVNGTVMHENGPGGSPAAGSC